MEHVYLQIKEIIKAYYQALFPWLSRCEKIFGFNLHGYGKEEYTAFSRTILVILVYKKYKF